MFVFSKVGAEVTAENEAGEEAEEARSVTWEKEETDNRGRRLIKRVEAPWSLIETLRCGLFLPTTVYWLRA
jgi:hypothetical protein